ncbi:MAG: Na+/solute symporter [Bacteroidetes bacterium]|nr:MAG: Na+/solute symporter [Bacteroidota bacterium]
MFGILTGRSTNEKFVPLIAILAPVICYVLNLFSEDWFGGYKFGNELLIVNGCLTFGGLWLLSKRGTEYLKPA